MAAKKGHEKAGGRKKGTPNRVTASVKEAITQAFEEWGGVPALVEFAKNEPGAFLTIWAKLLPTEVKASGDISHTVTVVVKRDRNFFGRSLAPRAAAPPDPNPGEPGPV